MTTYLLQRLFHGLTVLLGVSLLVFIAVELAPGDAVDAMLPPESFSSDDARDRMRERLGLNDPAPWRFVQWLGRTATGDLGYSLTSREPVGEIIARRLPQTLQLVGAALAISTITPSPAARPSGRRRGRGAVALAQRCRAGRTA